MKKGAVGKLVGRKILGSVKEEKRERKVSKKKAKKAKKAKKGNVWPKDKIKEKRQEAWKKMLAARKKKTRLTIRQRKFIREYLRTGNATQAALAAYNVSKRNAANLGYLLLHKNEKIKNALEKALEEEELNESYAVKKLKKVIDYGETSLEDIKPSDLLRALEMFFRLKGYLGKERKEMQLPQEEKAKKMTVKELMAELKRLDESQKMLLEFIKDGAEEGEIVDEEAAK